MKFNNNLIAIISHPECSLHNMGEGHPECPERVQAIDEELKNASFRKNLQFHQAKPATYEQLIKAHDSNYVKGLFEKSPSKGTINLDPDTCMMPFTLKAALLAAGAVIQAVDIVMQGDIKRVFCNVRPPGHHAERQRAMGFCFFNNIAVGAAYALEAFSVKRIAIIDFDVHHGNGTENIFQNDPRIYFFSSYQSPFYPFSTIPESNHISHIPLSAGCMGEQFREKVLNLWLPRLNNFAPELIMISAGFDAHANDPLAGLNLNEEDYHWITTLLLSVANQFSSGRVISTLEGGYDLTALKHSVHAHIQAFLS